MSDEYETDAEWWDAHRQWIAASRFGQMTMGEIADEFDCEWMSSKRESAALYYLNCPWEDAKQGIPLKRLPGNEYGLRVRN